jgi:hypothetical protein
MFRCAPLRGPVELGLTVAVVREIVSGMEESMPVHEHTGPKDRDRINVGDAAELNWWCQVLGVKEDELRRLVQELGPDAHKIRERVRK